MTADLLMWCQYRGSVAVVQGDAHYYSRHDKQPWWHSWLFNLLPKDSIKTGYAPSLAPLHVGSSEAVDESGSCFWQILHSPLLSRGNTRDCWLNRISAVIFAAYY